MAVKTDMSKAYDRIEWKFISDVLQQLGFHAVWINWVMQCVTTVSYSYLINDAAYGNVLPLRGIRQGDPLSPYVFILCSEVLSGMCREAARKGTLQGIRVARRCPRINHLLFADDTMFFCLASQTSCEALLTILADYGKASGQMINKSKSSITFSNKTPPAVKENVKLMLGITKEGGLGKIRQRAVSWSTKRLSKAGKLTMLKSILSAIPTYAMSCFQLPVNLCKRIQSVLTRFWWDDAEGNKKMCWVAWDQLTKPKDLGGLGLRDIQRFNQALLAKLAWRILTVPESLFARILTGNGQTTRIWRDSWISSNEVLKPRGPIKESDLELTVADLLTSELKWNKKRIYELLPDLAMQIQCIKPSTTGAEDSYIWHQTTTGSYSTKSGSNLQKRGMVAVVNCIRCQATQATETEVHCFFTCPFAKEVWDLIPLTTAVLLAAEPNFKDIVVSFRKASCLPPSGITLNILPWILWAIWTSRNTLIFEGRYLSPKETALKGIRLAKEWSASQSIVNDKNNLPRKPTERSRERPRTITDSNRVSCMTDAAWNKDRLTSGLGWLFSGPGFEPPLKGSVVESSIGSPLVAEASAIRSALCMAITLEISSLEVFSDNQTLVRAISGITQAKEIIGIVKDIRLISTEFASISFSHISRSLNAVADAIAKETLRLSISL
ncbi:uncharacterized protein LOC108831839 [Raphanus sativus]|uniref:Uncharacterized protein LOC108831839 n=1 Tax=Raphanus sativus TaxID=3726 RepID=A0A6J0LNC4_RAPSA|nr:uncharacterized protein LOC108831839 [Raphanus sativus]